MKWFTLLDSWGCLTFRLEYNICRAATKDFLQRPQVILVTIAIIIIMKYLLSANLWYIPELGALYKKKKKEREREARTVQQQ